MRNLLFGTVAMSAAILAAGDLVCPSNARAALIISGGFSTTPTPPGTANSNSSGGNLVFSNYAFSNFTINGLQVGETSQHSPEAFDTNLDVTSSGAGTLYAWITEQGLTSPSGLTNFKSGFTLNIFPTNFTSAQLITYVSPTNQLFAGTMMSHTTFTTTNSTNYTVSTPSLPSTSPDWSETAEYIFTFSGASEANPTIDMTDASKPTIPEPASLVLLGTSLLGIGAIRRRRRRT